MKILRCFFSIVCTIFIFCNFIACDTYIGKSSSETQVISLKDTNFNMDNIKNNTVVVTDTHTVALKNDGSVIATGSNVHNQCDVESWQDIVSLYASENYTIGLKSNGSIEVTKYVNSWDNFNISDWFNICDIYTDDNYMLGIQKDGTILISGDFNGEISSWSSIVYTSKGLFHMAKLNQDGSVIAVGENNYNQCDVQNWKDIVQVSATNGYSDIVSFESYSHTVGLKSDGSVVATGYNGDLQCDVQSWNDIVSIATGTAHTVGLKNDGSVVATGNNDYSQCEVQNWYDVVSIYTANHHTVGLKSDGTLLATGDNLDGQCNVQTWKDIKVE